MWLFAVNFCSAQQPASDPVPLLLVYATKYGDNVTPRIALGLEKPALRVRAFEKCARISAVASKNASIAVQLKPDDAKTLVAAMEALEGSDPQESTRVELWFTTPDNKILGAIIMALADVNGNNLKAGVIEFDSGGQQLVVEHLTETLHPQ